MSRGTDCRHQSEAYVSATSDRIARKDEAADRAPRDSPGFCPSHFKVDSILSSNCNGRWATGHVAQLIQAKRLTPEGKIIGLQRKLTVGAADDQYEQEADRVARQVMNYADAVAANSMQRAMSPEENKDKMLQTKPLAASITPFVQRQMANNEEPEDKEKPIQAKFLTETSREPLQRQPETEEEDKNRSRPNLSDQCPTASRLETMSKPRSVRAKDAAVPCRTLYAPTWSPGLVSISARCVSIPAATLIQMNRDVGAQAFTHGSDIYFGAGSSPTNLELTAHELTHVVQQTGDSSGEASTLVALQRKQTPTEKELATHNRYAADWHREHDTAPEQARGHGFEGAHPAQAVGGKHVGEAGFGRELSVGAAHRATDEIAHGAYGIAEPVVGYTATLERAVKQQNNFIEQKTKDRVELPEWANRMQGHSIEEAQANVSMLERHIFEQWNWVNSFNSWIPIASSARTARAELVEAAGIMGFDLTKTPERVRFVKQIEQGLTSATDLVDAKVLGAHRGTSWSDRGRTRVRLAQVPNSRASR